MDYVSILNTPLKSDFLNDLFEVYEVEVTYDYDRCSENMNDEYRASIPEMWLEFIFNHNQLLSTLFMKPVEHSGYNPFDGVDPRRVAFYQASDAMEHAEKNNIKYIHQVADKHPLFGAIPEYVKYEFETFSVHYQFDNGVDMVTLQWQNA